VYLATISLQFLHLTISVLPHLGQGKIVEPFELDILFLHEIQIWFSIAFGFPLLFINLTDNENNLGKLAINL